MKTATTLALTVLTSITILLSGCKENYELGEEVDYSTEQDTTTDLKILASGSQTNKLWRDAMKCCMSSDAFKNAKCMGFSNTIVLGTIASRNGLTTRMRLQDAFSPEEIISMIDTGSFAPCNCNSEIETDFNIVLGGQIDITGQNQGVNAEINAALKKSRKTSLVINQWRKQEIVTGVLNSLLQNTSDPKKLRYKEEKQKLMQVLMTKHIQVKDCTCRIELSDSLSVSAQAQIDSGLIKGLNQLGGEFNVKRSGSRIIEITTQNTFYPLGIWRLSRVQ